MPINAEALNLVKVSGITGDNIANDMATMAEQAPEGSMLVFTYLPPSGVVKEGELIPSVILVLKPHQTQRALIEDTE